MAIGYTAVIPVSTIDKMQIYVNSSKLSMSAIRKKLGCDYLLNAGLFSMTTFKPVNWLVVDGTVLSRGGNPYGYAIQDNKIAYSYENNKGYSNFIGGYPRLVHNGAISSDPDPSGLGGDRGRSAMGLTSDSLILRCVPDLSGMADYTLSELKADMLKAGCVSAVNFDGGGSSQCYFNGQTITSTRIVHNYICVWVKKTTAGGDDTVSTYTNGSTRKPVYETTACTKQIGSLDPNETCTQLYAYGSFKVVMYYITGTTERKVGFIKA